jgi:hypothetical protein
MSPEEMKAAFKEAIKEWMNEQVTKLGWSVIKWATSAIVVGIAYFLLYQNGWRRLGG